MTNDGKHTPAPWTLDWEHSRRDVDLCSGYGMVSRSAWFIALDGCLDGTDDEHRETFKADVELIATAPDMREELDRKDALIQEMLEALKGMQINYPGLFGPNEKALRAIAKAEGKP